MSPRQPRHRSLRALAAVLIATQVAGTVPVRAAEAMPAAQPAPPPMKVNRKVPAVQPVPLSPVFSAEPTDDELFRARVTSGHACCGTWRLWAADSRGVTLAKP